MERVLPLEWVPSLRKTQGAQGRTLEGVVEKELEKGTYRVSLADGTSLQVRAQASLKTGQKVQVFFPEEQSSKVEDPATESRLKGEGIQWAAFLPLGFGGKGATAKLEVFVEKRPKGEAAKKAAAYFVFTVRTEAQGEIQWSVYLKEHSVLLQVFASLGGDGAGDLKSLVREVEKSLLAKGYSFAGPTAILSRPFTVPAGFRLNVRG